MPMVEAMQGSNVVAAIGTDGNRPVVWGLGATAELAIEEANEQEPTWNEKGWATCKISGEIAARIDRGVVDCGTLGIWVGIDRDGRIYVAELS